MRRLITLKQQHARNVIKVAIRRGILIRPKVCQRCGEKPTKALHAHHHNGYDNPLDVVWYCARCHGQVHGGALLFTSEDCRRWATENRATQTPEHRAKIARGQWEGTTPEQRSSINRERAQRLTQEQRRAKAIKGVQAQTPEQRRAKSLKAAQSQTPEQRRTKALKGQETRRLRRLAQS